MKLARLAVGGFHPGRPRATAAAVAQRRDRPGIDTVAPVKVERPGRRAETAANHDQAIADQLVDARIPARMVAQRGDVAGFGDKRERLSAIERRAEIGEWRRRPVTRAGRGEYLGCAKAQHRFAEARLGRRSPDLQDEIDAPRLQQVNAERGQRAAGRTLEADGGIGRPAAHHAPPRAPDIVDARVFFEQAPGQSLDTRPGTDRVDPVDGRVIEISVDDRLQVA